MILITSIRGRLLVVTLCHLHGTPHRLADTRTLPITPHRVQRMHPASLRSPDPRFLLCTMALLSRSTTNVMYRVLRPEGILAARRS